MRAFSNALVCHVWLLTFGLVVCSGCGADYSEPAAGNGKNGADSAGTIAKVNADGTIDLETHRQTILHLEGTVREMFSLLSGFDAADTATDEQKAQLKEVATPFKLGEAKDAIAQFFDWMDQLDQNQVQSLRQALDGMQTWIDDMRACYPFAIGGNVAALKSHIDSLEKDVQAIKADLPQ